MQGGVCMWSQHLIRSVEIGILEPHIASHCLLLCSSLVLTFDDFSLVTGCLSNDRIVVTGRAVAVLIHQGLHEFRLGWVNPGGVLLDVSSVSAGGVVRHCGIVVRV